MDYTSETENFFVREELVPSLEEISDKAKRTIKDSVFTNLFSDKKYVLEVYQALFPDDTDVTQNDIKTGAVRRRNWSSPKAILHDRCSKTYGWTS